MKKQFTTKIEDLEVEITFDYIPEEPSTRDYRGGSAKVESVGVTYERKMLKLNYMGKRVEWTERFDITDILIQLGIDVDGECFGHIEKHGQ